MQKIPTLFVRNPEDRRYVTDEVTPGCEWVLAGEGVATRKYDGTCVMLDEDGEWWARREVKPGKDAPPNYQPKEHDETTGKTVGWEPIEQSAFYKFFQEAVTARGGWSLGTYELVGPKINGNPERQERHALIRHGWERFTGGRLVPTPTDPRELAALVASLGREGVEGIVWYHPDGRMAKLKARDYPT